MTEWDSIFGGAPPEVFVLADALRHLILSVHLGVVVVYRPGDRGVSYGWGPRKMSEAYAYLMPQKTYVNLGFYQGALLPDPAGLLEGTGKALRHVKIRDPAAVADPALLTLIRAAMTERQAALGL